jgi:uncharacterized protein GlcG (DUF336 family)
VSSSGNKAATALAFATPTGALGEHSKTNQGLADRIAANPAYNSRAGGVPITIGGETAGAVGVGGARGSDKDEECALVAVERLSRP